MPTTRMEPPPHRPRVPFFLFDRTENAWPAPVRMKITWAPGERLRGIGWRCYAQPMTRAPRIQAHETRRGIPRELSVAGRDAGAQAEAAVAFVLGRQQAAEAGHAVGHVADAAAPTTAVPVRLLGDAVVDPVQVRVAVIGPDGDLAALAPAVPQH